MKNDSKKEEEMSVREVFMHTRSNIQKGTDMMPKDLNYVVLYSSYFNKIVV
jgi:hypothetical protein